METLDATFKTLKITYKNKTECSKKTEILCLVLEDKVGKFFSFPQAEMEKDFYFLIAFLWNKCLKGLSNAEGETNICGSLSVTEWDFGLTFEK